MTPHWRATESLSSTTMINTYQTSAFPPQPPPRHTSLPAEHLAPRRGPTRAVVRVLGLVVVLHLLLSCGGFYYLYTGRMISPLESAKPNEEGKISAQTSERRSEKASPKVMAGMTVKRPPSDIRSTPSRSGGGQYLQWNMDHSILKNVGYYWASWLKVQQPGDYYVYARVSFSGGGTEGMPLVSMVKRKHNDTGKPHDVMKAYCSLGNHNTGPCTASQGQVLSLQMGNLLSVWVENHTWVDYERGATTFGMFKL
ncbi:CD40 ligand [Gadus morhua]|uniref:Uncharacterized LOC115551901 n=1 Tax=Gadus morhua TaxID=8049 RepID=A0A8C5CYM9_GADMO|nr:uncharacterized protein LOC115551901 [Gadus morhua]